MKQQMGVTVAAVVCAGVVTGFLAAMEPNARQAPAPGEGHGYVGLKNLPADAWTDCPGAYREAQSVPLTQHRSMWGPHTMQMPEYFVISAPSLERLRTQETPEDILGKLKPLVDRKIRTREELLKELGALLSAAELEQYRNRILIAAMGPARRGRRFDTNLVVPIGPIPDAKNVIYDSDSYPRKPAKLVGKPTVAPLGKDAFLIEFEIDRPDDVEVRVVDAQGGVIRRLGAGVIGLATAPEPFRGGSLKQRVEWDGMADNGKPAPQGWRVEIGVGLQPQFGGFVGYDPGQLTPYLAGLQIDPKGRVYIWKHTYIREDPILVRFDRDGKYLDMVYPSNPKNLQALGKKLEDVCERVERFGDRKVPIWERLLYSEICRWDQFNNIPFVIDPNGHAWFVELLNQHSHPPFFPENVAHVFGVEDLDRFWLQPYYAYGMTGAWQILHNTAATTTDRKGAIYVAIKRFEDHHALTGMMDKNQVGTIIKIDPATRQGINDFTYLGEEKLDKPRYYLGQPAEGLNPRSVNPIYEKHFDVFIDKKDVAPLPQDTEKSFIEIQSLTVDDDGNILVADGLPRRIKMYAANGKWLGETKGLTVGGRFRAFHDLAEVGHGPNAHYVITSFKDDPGQSHLIKCRNLESDPQVIWTVPLDERSRYIAVDRNVSPNLIWVGNGGGLAMFTRVEDRGDQPGEVRHFGGIRAGVFVDPWKVAASTSGKVFVYDHGTRALVATDTENKTWKSRVVHEADPAIEYSERHRVFMHVETRGGDVSMQSLVANDATQQVWTSHRDGHKMPGYASEHARWPLGSAKSPGVVGYDFDLNPLTTKFQDDAGNTNFVAARNVPMPNPFAQSYRTNNILYNAPIQNQRWATSTQGRLIGRMIPHNGRDGKAMDWIRLALEIGSGSMTVDSRGNIYVLDLIGIPPYSKGDALFGFPNERAYHNGQQCTADSYFFQRGDRYVTHQTEMIDLVKFGSLGGVRHTEDERWAHRGAGFIPASCGGCDVDVNTLACDGADRIFAADSTHNLIKVLDTAGHLIAITGRYGNAETAPAPGGPADELGFSSLYNIAAANDTVFATDRDLARVAMITMDYRERRTARVEQRAAAAAPTAKPPAPSRAASPKRAPIMKNGAAEIAIQSPGQITVGDWDWDGPADASALARLEKTPTGLRLTVDVTDDNLQAEAPPWAPSDGDSIEFYLDVRPPEQRTGASYQKGVMQIFIAPGLGKTEDRIVISQRGRAIRLIPGMTSASKRTKTGYQVTVTIPSAGLAADHYAPGDSIGFDVGVNDNDDGVARTTQLMAIGTNSNWMDPRGFGEALFAKP